MNRLHSIHKMYLNTYFLCDYIRWYRQGEPAQIVSVRGKLLHRNRRRWDHIQTKGYDITLQVIKIERLRDLDHPLLMPDRRSTAQAHTKTRRASRWHWIVHLTPNRLNERIPLSLHRAIGTRHRIAKEDISQPIKRIWGSRFRQSSPHLQCSSQRIPSPQPTIEPTYKSSLHSRLYRPHRPNKSTTPSTNKGRSPC